MAIVDNIEHAQELIADVEASVGIKANAIEQLMVLLSQIYDDDKSSDMICTLLEGIATMLERDRKKAEEAAVELKQVAQALR